LLQGRVGILLRWLRRPAGSAEPALE